jgi:serine/threonine-protein kinase RsbW
VAEVDEALHLVVPATPEHVGRLRRAVRRWLRSVLGDEDEDAVDNLTLAASEALENAAEHAYAGHDEVGTMTLSARRDDTADRAVVITVSDSGRWRAPADSTGYRGRGLALIGELTDTHEVQPGPTGTTVTFRHAG